VRLQYLISFKESHLSIRIEEKGAPRRVLYWDTLTSLAAAEDREVLPLLRKAATRFSKNLETLSFQTVDIPFAEAFEAMRLLSKTKRLFYNRQPLLSDWNASAKLFFRGKKPALFEAFFEWGKERIPLAACEKVFASWCIWNGNAFPFRTELPWKWVDLFLKGPVSLEGVQKSRFLEEEPPLEWEEESVAPRLQLTDATGCFANLLDEAWEQDLFEAGYVKKTVGNSRYFCPSDKTRDALLLLVDVGWEVFLPGGKRLLRQGKTDWELKEDGPKALLRGSVSFGPKTTPLKPVFEAMKKGRLWVEIDGQFAGLLDRAKGEAMEGEWVGESLVLPKGKAAQLIPLLDTAEAVWEEALFNTVKGLKEGRLTETALPGSSFRGELLPHQQKGLDWLWFLYSQGFSGLLADEMGLGKTVQVLAFFSRLRTNLPTLIVAPASLLHQWQSEIRRFLPGARSLIYQPGVEISACDYLIASYARLRLDEETLSAVEWEAVVLDESNAIKTASTQTAKAACRLKARFRIALSGTPIENRAEELGSQFSFLMPGLVQNIQSDAKKLKPFILRRKKDELSLPPRLEQTVLVEMEEGQRRLYDSYIQGLKTGLLKKAANDGAAAHRMEILEAILRLRQIAADPRLIGREERGAKMERMLADLEEALGEKRKVLIYSQFTTMLSLIGKELGRPYLLLDGSVDPSSRAERVRAFQTDPDIPLFLLSLKAGGVGLNLTAADYVLLFDPWWNDAAENQAIDRAHRIGQTKTVIAKRYIAAGTIEEKILGLKTEKRQAAEALLGSGQEFNWTEEDLLHLLS